VPSRRELPERSVLLRRRLLTTINTFL